MRMIYFFAVVSTLTGCATTSEVSQSSASKPSDYEQIVRAQVKSTFFDPYSLRDAAISEPFRTDSVFDGVTPIPHSGWMVCLKANSKNQLGAYTGLQSTAFLIEGQTIAVTLSGPQYRGQIDHHCAAAQYKPFAIETS